MNNSSCLNLQDITSHCCSTISPLFCKKCEACLLKDRINKTKSWFLPLSFHQKKYFILSLIHSCSEIKTILESIFQNFDSKDFKYTKSRSQRKNYQDVTNHSLDMNQISTLIHERYYIWFYESSEWSKRNYLFFLLQLCGTDLLDAIRSSIQELFFNSFSSDDEEEILFSTIEDNKSKIVTYQSEPILPTKSVLKSPVIHNNRRWSAKDQVTFSGDFKDVSDSKLSQFSSRPGSSFTRHSSKIQFSEHPVFTSARCTPIIQSRAGSPSTIISTPLSLGQSWSPVFKRISSNIDFLKSLPVHLSKKILGYLNENSVKCAANVCKQWNYLAKEVLSEMILLQIAREDVMLMQAGSSKTPNPFYARKVPVYVPNLTDDHELIMNNESQQVDLECLYDEFHDINMEDCYEGLEMKLVTFEERNVYCGSYNIFVLEPHKDAHRCFNYNQGEHVVLGSTDRKIRILDVDTGKCVTSVSGHTGSIKCLFVDEQNQHVISGSYDLTVRVWDIKTGRCKFLFRGHKKSVIVVTGVGNYVASASADKSVKIWNLTTSRCKRTLIHKTSVTVIKLNGNTMLTGCASGKVFLWDIEKSLITKHLEGHSESITGVCFTPYHVLSSCQDGYVILWSNLSNLKKPLRRYRHPKEVLSLNVCYCRIITGCLDGKIRVWNMLNGECLRVIRGNSKNDAILNLVASKNRLVVNTLSCVLIYNFEPVDFDYTAPRERASAKTSHRVYQTKLNAPHSVTRAEKVRAHGSPIHKQHAVNLNSDLSTSRVHSAPVNNGQVKVQHSTSCSVKHHIRRIKSAHCLKQSHAVNVKDQKDGCLKNDKLDISTIYSRKITQNANLCGGTLESNMILLNLRNTVNKVNGRCKSAPIYKSSGVEKILRTTSFCYSQVTSNKMIPKYHKKPKRPETARTAKSSDNNNFCIRNYNMQLQYEEMLRKK